MINAGKNLTGAASSVLNTINNIKQHKANAAEQKDFAANHAANEASYSGYKTLKDTGGEVAREDFEKHNKRYLSETKKTKSADAAWKKEQATRKKKAVAEQAQGLAPGDVLQEAEAAQTRFTAKPTNKKEKEVE